MNEWVRILLFLLTLFGARHWAQYRPISAYRLAFSLVLITVALWAASVLTGLLRRSDAGVADSHRWLGHGLVIVAWIASAVSLDALFGQAGWLGPIGVLARCILVCAALGSCLFAASTGYIAGPEPDAQLRFQVLHEAGFSLVSLALIGAWLKIMRWPRVGGEPHIEAH
jgi:hypothetical protein